MVGTAIQHTSMDIGARSAGKAVEEVMNQFSLQIANQTLPYLGVHHGSCAPAKIHRCQSQSLIHRHDEIPCAQNPPLRSQRFVKRLAENDAHVFHGVVLVYIKIALGTQFEVEASVTGE